MFATFNNSLLGGTKNICSLYAIDEKWKNPINATQHKILKCTVFSHNKLEYYLFVKIMQALEGLKGRDVIVSWICLASAFRLAWLCCVVISSSHSFTHPPLTRVNLCYLECWLAY